MICKLFVLKKAYIYNQNRFHDVHTLTTLLVESFAGTNFLDANVLVVCESLHPRNRSVQVIRESS